MEVDAADVSPLGCDHHTLTVNSKEILAPSPMIMSRLLKVFSSWQKDQALISEDLPENGNLMQCKLKRGEGGATVNNTNLQVWWFLNNSFFPSSCFERLACAAVERFVPVLGAGRQIVCWKVSQLNHEALDKAQVGHLHEF